MHAEATRSAELEVCDACEGLWIDWFDGDVQTLAVEHEAARLDRGTPPPRARPVAGAGTCPRCTCALAPELYRFVDATDDELITGVELLRCPTCAGAFVPRGSAHLLLDRQREARPRGPLEALLARLARVRQLFGKDRTDR